MSSMCRSRPRHCMSGAMAAKSTRLKPSPRDVKWNDPEPLLGGVVDLGALATEFLILGLDPYPRKSGAVFEAPPDRKPEDSPFAALAKLTKGQDDR